LPNDIKNSPRYWLQINLDTGGGIIAGVCVAFIATIADRMINARAAKRKREYGFE